MCLRYTEDKYKLRELMKLFSTKQIAEIDRYTIGHEPVAEIDLMERAAMQVTLWLKKKYGTDRKILLLAGPGNNGGDALAVARQMTESGYPCELFLYDGGKGLNGSPAINLKRLENLGRATLKFIGRMNDFPVTTPGDVIVDGLFGSGLSRPLEGLPAEIVQRVNSLPNEVIAIDIPSGLMGEDNSVNVAENIIKADFTLAFQFPKISFLFAENEKYLGKWEVLPIGLHQGGIENSPSEFFLTEKEDVRKLIVPRSKFSHKGTFGHALLIAGSYGKTGAAVLASRACLRAGAGLLTTHVPHFSYPIVQATVPEAMVSVDAHDSIFTEFPDLEFFNAIGAGPGIGMKTNTRKALYELITQAHVPLVLDADALNILSENSEWMQQLPENSILTPHPGEFRKLAGETANSWERIQMQRQLAISLKVIVVLKGAYTSVALSDGRLFFNSSGNPGMATAGSGDTLTGIILGLLACRMKPEHAAIAGVYLHGLAGDLAAKVKSEPALVAGDIIENLGQAFLEMG
jgi:ADP-dependent NAD(P)H-hydrate dehydratase / NAD(P)H-hydrate epimerase